MKAEALRARIDSLTQDLDFTYQGKDGSICPFSRTDISLCYDGVEVTVQSVDAAMSEPFVNGRSLSELAGELIV